MVAENAEAVTFVGMFLVMSSFLSRGTEKGCEESGSDAGAEKDAYDGRRSCRRCADPIRSNDNDPYLQFADENARVGTAVMALILELDRHVVN